MHSSSDVGGWRRQWMLGLSAVTVLLAMEGGLRLISGSLDAPLQWYSPQAQRKAAELDELSADQVRMDVAFVGSSMTNSDIDIETFERRTGLSAWNGGIPAAQGRVVERWTGEEVVPALSPGLVVIGLSSLELNDNRPDPTIDLYDRQLRTRNGFFGDLDRFAADNSYTFRYRSQLRKPYSFLIDLFDLDAELSATDAEASLRAERRRIEAEVLHNYQFGGAELAAFDRLIGELIAQGRAVAVAWMPVPDRFIELHPGGPAEFEAAKAAVLAMSERRGVPFIDMSHVEPDDSFTDFTHLEDDAARRVTVLLASELADVAVLDGLGDG